MTNGLNNNMDLVDCKKGDKITFQEEKKAYTIGCRDVRYLICTKPHNPKRTVLYTIVDLFKRIRGTENLVFCMGFETNEQCENALIRLQSGESEVSHRNNIPIKIKTV